MKPARVLPTIVWLLLGLLALSAATLSLGHNDNTARPNPSSYTPSGTRAFADLLRTEGYTVSYTDSPHPITEGKPVLVAFAIPEVITSPFEDTNQAFGTGLRNGTDRQIAAYVKNGGNAILLCLSSDFAEATKKAQKAPITLQTSSGQKVISVDPVAIDPLPGETDKIPLEAVSAGPLASISHIGSGTVLTVNDGIIATNRFIDQKNNASYLLSWVAHVARPGSSFLVLGASYDEAAEPGLMETMGAWAIAAWWQLIFLFLVIVFTLGKPFGYPDEARLAQRSSREFVDAVAETYKRADATNVVLTGLEADAEQEIRNRLKLSREVGSEELNRMIPPELALALRDVKAARTFRLTADQTFGVAKRLDAQMRAFFGERKTRTKRKKTR